MTAKLIQELYQQLALRDPRLEGWASWDKAMALMATAWALRPEVAVEIGVWAGRSLLPVALVLRETGKGQIHAIDPWQPGASGEGYAGANKEWWEKSANHQYAKRQFDDLINDAGLFHIVRIHQKKSDEVTPPETIDLLHIDGQHSPQARRDVDRFARNVRVGGICFMDDISWCNDGIHDVALAVKDLIGLGFVRLYGVFGKGADGITSDCEVYQRVK